MFSNFTTTKKPNKSLVFPQPVGLTRKSATTPRFYGSQLQIQIFFTSIVRRPRVAPLLIAKHPRIYFITRRRRRHLNPLMTAEKEGTNAANFITFIRNFNASSIWRNQQRSGDTLDEKSALKIPLTTRLDNEKMNLSLEATTTTT